MHGPIRDRLEEFLDDGEHSGLREFRDHMAGCESCRREVDELAAQGRLLRALRAPRDLEPSPGFYAAVLQSIEKRRRQSAVYAFLDPGLGLRLMLASLAAIVVLGAYVLFSQPEPSFGSSNPVTILAAGAPDYGHFGASPQQDRETMLLTLASYQE